MSGAGLRHNHAMEPGSRPQRRDDILMQAAGDTVVLLTPDSGEYFNVEVGGRIWELADGTRSIEEIAAVLDRRVRGPAGGGPGHTSTCSRSSPRRGSSRMARLPRSPREAARMLHVAVVATLAPLLARLPLARQEALLVLRRRRRLDAARAAWLEQNVDRVIAVSHPVVRTGCLTRGLTHF